jgi:hypothetical protein
MPPPRQGSLLFGHRNAGFSTMAHSFVTLFRAALGDYNFEELVEVNPKLAAAFFMLYQIIQGLVVLNMIIAVISEAYEQVAFVRLSGSVLVMGLQRAVAESVIPATPLP